MDPAARSIQNEQEYRDAMASLERIFSTAEKGTPEGDEFERLLLLISDWERRIVAIERPRKAP